MPLAFIQIKTNVEIAVWRGRFFLSGFKVIVFLVELEEHYETIISAVRVLSSFSLSLWLLNKILLEH